MCPICILRELLYGHKNVIDCSLTSKTVKQDSLWQLYEIKQTAKIYELTIFMYNISANKSPIGTNCLNSHADIPVDSSIKKKKTKSFFIE